MNLYYQKQINLFNNIDVYLTFVTFIDFFLSCSITIHTIDHMMTFWIYHILISPAFAFRRQFKVFHVKYLKFMTRYTKYQVFI